MRYFCIEIKHIDNTQFKDKFMEKKEFRTLTEEELKMVNGGGGVYDGGAGNVCVGLSNICRANGKLKKNWNNLI